MARGDRYRRVCGGCVCASRLNVPGGHWLIRFQQVSEAMRRLSVASVVHGQNATQLGADPIRPLCVDLDGTLVDTDLSAESLFGVLKRQPWLLLWVPFWLLQGKARLKKELAERCQPDATVLPYNQAVMDHIDSATIDGRKVVLVTGSNRRLADQVAGHLGLFDQVLASDSEVNLTGRRKADLLNNLFGVGGYEYMGNDQIDLQVWQTSAAAVTVNAPRSVVEQVSRLGIPHTDIAPARRTLRSWLKAIRVHQWSKNALLFVPAVTGHRIFELEALAACALGFLCFGLLASATYIVNDLFDLDADRHHRTKRHRPFAAGVISLQAGIVASAILLLSGLTLALLLPVGFQLTLLAYLGMTLAYSFWFKRVASVDVLLLAALYTIRVVAGAFAIGIDLSFWLLAFSMFVFLSLALVKRVAELIELREKQRAVRPMISADQGNSLVKGREYSTEDIPILQNLGASSGYLAVLVLALYIHSPDVLLLYQSPQILWLVAPLMLLWVTRLWVMTARGYMDEDPVVFAMKDPETWLAAGFTAATLAAAMFVSI
jgi:4-hydroxybenzoate polyprenyltransferase